MCLSVVSEVEPYAVRIARTVPGGARTARCAPTRQRVVSPGGRPEQRHAVAKNPLWHVLGNLRMHLTSGTPRGVCEFLHHALAADERCRVIHLPLVNFERRIDRNQGQVRRLTVTSCELETVQLHAARFQSPSPLNFAFFCCILA